MRISIQKQTQTPEQKAAGDDGEMLSVSSAEFETIAQAKRFLYNIQQKYGQIRHQEYFSPEQGSAGYYTEAKQDNNKIITYWFYFDGFEGELLNMLSQNIKQASRKIISSRDIIADIDYSKSADRDALALENLAKKLHDYLASGKTNNNELTNYANEILNIANDLNEILGRISPETSDDFGDEYAGLGAGAKQRAGLRRSAGAVKAAIEDIQEKMSEAEGREVSWEEAEAELNNRARKNAALTKEAASECRHCDFIGRDPYELNDHQNEKHLGQKPFKPLNRNYGFNLLNTAPERRPKSKFDRKLRGDDLEPEEEL